MIARLRVYDHLFLDARPDAGGKDCIDSLNPKCLKMVTAILEPSFASAKLDDKFPV